MFRPAGAAHVRYSAVDAHVLGAEIARPDRGRARRRRRGRPRSRSSLPCRYSAASGAASSCGMPVLEEHDAADRAPSRAIDVERDAGPAGRGDDAAPVGIAAVDGGLHERRVGDRLAPPAAHRRSSRAPVTRDRDRAWSRLRRRARCPAPARGDTCEQPVEQRRIAAPRRSSTPLAPLASAKTQSLVEHSPSTVMALNVSRADVDERAVQQRRRHRGIGREEAEHRRHVRLDHARALGHAADAERRRAPVLHARPRAPWETDRSS